jgi:hypothetical protein
MYDREDKDVYISKSLPAANATAYTDSLYVGHGRLHDFELELGHEALPVLADAKAATLKLQDSADNVNFTDVGVLSSLVTTGAGGVGAGANAVRLSLPSTVRAYVRASANIPTSGGNNTDKKFYLKGKF